LQGMAGFAISDCAQNCAHSESSRLSRCAWIPECFAGPALLRPPGDARTAVRS